MNGLMAFMKNWALPMAIITGIISYLLYVSMPVFDITRPWINNVVAILQPTLIFAMLFITFCNIGVRDLRPHRWQFWLVIFQMSCFFLMTIVLYGIPETTWKVVLECAMLCRICPTATAGAVVTAKMGGNAAAITTYTIIINSIVAFVAPAMIPVLYPQEGMSFLPAFQTILQKVFPVLICPLLLAWLFRYYIPALHQVLVRYRDCAFYLWTVSLAIAVAVSCKVLAHSNVSFLLLTGIGIVSLVCCLIQFAVGKKIGAHYSMRLEGGQSLGQKNTVFAIWLGYTFLNPITALAGGFYSIWHNLVNSYELYKYRNSGKIE